MASLAAAQTGNFTSASTWQTIDSNGEIDNEGGTVAISTSNIDSPTFTPGAITVDAILLKMSARATSPTGTISITLRNSTLSSDVETVTLNVSDLPNPAAGFPEWITVKMASSHLLLAANTYIVRVICSNTGTQVTLYRSTTGTNNFSKKIRTTTTQAPAAGDHMVITKQYTGAGASTAVTVTLDNTATTSFGPTVSGGPPQGMVVSGAGALLIGTSASTAYYLKLKGILLVSLSASFNLGSLGSEIPTSSSFTLFFDCVANGDSGFQAPGIVNVYGAPKTWMVQLTADASAGATNLTVDAQSGWQTGDELAISATGATDTQGELKTAGTINSSTSVDVAALTNAHKGTSPVQAEVANMTRNVLFTAASSSLRGFFRACATGSILLKDVQFSNMGLNTSSKAQIEIETTSGSLQVENCAFRTLPNGQGVGIRAAGAAHGNWTVKNCSFYDCVPQIMTVAATSTSTWSIDGICSINPSGVDNTTGLSVNDGNPTIVRRLYISGRSGNVSYGIAITDSVVVDLSKFGAMTIHNCGAGGVLLQDSGGSTVQANENAGDWTLFFNGSGLRCDAAIVGTLTNLTLFGNVSQNCYVSSKVADLVMKNCFMAGHSTKASAIGLLAGNGSNASYCRIKFVGGSVGVVSGSFAAHSTADVQIQQGSILRCVFQRTAGSIGTTSGLSTLNHDGSFVKFQGYNATDDDHRMQLRGGIGKYDSAIFQTLAPSQRLTPSSATVKLPSAVSSFFRKPGLDGADVTIAVAVRKSSSGDGAAYNGNQPRLIVRANAGVGVAADTVLDTMTSSAGSWETLTGTVLGLTDDGVLEFYVDCDGTAGWINVDDWA